jgi:hypothetical protein
VEFFVHRPLKWTDYWLACSLHKPQNFIRANSEWHTPEEAAAVATALQMAIDWLAMEKAGEVRG